MALSSYWVSMNRKDLAERAIVSKREQDAFRLQKNEAVASYHRDLALKSSKYKNLEELMPSKTSRSNEESRVKEQIKATKLEKLEVRQRKLAHLLAVENEQYMKELTNKVTRERETDPWNISKLKEQISELERRRKEGQQNSQKRYMHHIWKCSSPCLKENEQEIIEKDLAETWEKQKKDSEMVALARQRQAKHDREVYQQKKLEATEELENIEMRIQEEDKRRSTSSDQAKVILSGNEQERKDLVFEEQMLEQLLNKVESLLEMKTQTWDLHTQEDQIVSLWHPQEKIKRMSREVLKRLSNDIDMLNTITNFNQLLEDVKVSVRLDVNQVAIVKEILESQVSAEKDRLQTFQHLFHEEANKLWDKQFSEWNKDTSKRTQLLRQLLESIKADIKFKISLNNESQQRVCEIRKNCMQQIENHHNVFSEVSKELEAKKKLCLDRVKALEQELERHDAKHVLKDTN